MPIHEQTYRRYEGERTPRGTAWGVIASTGLRALVRRKLFLLVMLFAWAPFVVQAVMLYLWANFPQMDALAPTAATFRNFFERQGFFAFIVTVYVGAGLIASDRRAHALQLYLSKPLTRAEYVAGKLAILFVLVLSVTWLPAILLLLLQVLFAGNVSFVRTHGYLAPGLTVFGIIYALVASLAMLALSSLSTSARFVAVLYTGLLLFTQAIAGVVSAVAGHSWWSWLSFRANLAQLGDVILRMPPRYDMSWTISAAVVVVILAAAMMVLARQVRGVEVVT